MPKNYHDKEKKNLKQEEFNASFFDIIELLDQKKKKNPQKDLIAQELIKKGHALDRQTFLQCMSNKTTEQQNKLLDFFYCVKGFDDQDYYLKCSQIEALYQESIQISENKKNVDSQHIADSSENATARDSFLS